MCDAEIGGTATRDIDLWPRSWPRCPSMRWIPAMNRGASQLWISKVRGRPCGCTARIRHILHGNCYLICMKLNYGTTRRVGRLSCWNKIDSDVWSVHQRHMTVRQRPDHLKCCLGLTPPQSCPEHRLDGVYLPRPATSTWRQCQCVALSARARARTVSWTWGRPRLEVIAPHVLNSPSARRAVLTNTLCSAALSLWDGTGRC